MKPYKFRPMSNLRLLITSNFLYTSYIYTQWPKEMTIFGWTKKRFNINLIAYIPTYTFPIISITHIWWTVSFSWYSDLIKILKRNFNFFYTFQQCSKFIQIYASISSTCSSTMPTSTPFLREVKIFEPEILLNNKCSTFY